MRLSVAVGLLSFVSLTGVLSAQVPVGAEFQVNTYTTGTQNDSNVAGSLGCDFVVAWRSDGSSGSDSDARSVQAQRVTPSGLLIGNEFQVNSYTTQSQRTPNVGIAANGDFVVVWSSDGLGNFIAAWNSNGPQGTDTDSWSVQARLFTTGLIFTDGFESGDPSSWSNSVP